MGESRHRQRLEVVGHEELAAVGQRASPRRTQQRQRLRVLAGLIILANQFPSIDKYVHPVEKRAMHAMEESVASPIRIAFSVLAGLALTEPSQPGRKGAVR